MNSNRIRALFGSYIVDVLAQNDTQRVASLCSVHDGTHICRTLAVTRFHTPVPAVLADAHQRIRAGSSIGETLSGLGIETSKINDRWCQWPAGDYFSSLTGGTVSPNEAISLRLYTLRTRISERAIDYAVIAEAYHPAHFPVSDECQDRLSAHEQDVVDEQTLKTLCHILDQGL